MTLFAPLILRLSHVEHFFETLNELELIGRKNQLEIRYLIEREGIKAMMRRF